VTELWPDDGVGFKPGPMTGSLDVNGYQVLTRAAKTSIQKGNRSLTLEDLRDGDQVHVRACSRERTSSPTRSNYQEEEEDDPDEEEQVTRCHILLATRPNARR